MFKKSAAPSGYFLTKSLRFRSSASAYLQRTPASAGSQTTWTFSAWVKRGNLDSAGTYTLLNCADGGGNNRTFMDFEGDGTFLFSYFDGATYPVGLITTPVYRDPASWYHVVLVYDSTQATSSNRAKLYINGTQVTAFSTATYPSQNATTTLNSTQTHAIGRRVTYNDRYYDGYLAETNFIDGQALTPSSFGSTNALTGVWQPAKYTGTYGTNGFYLKFTDITSTATLGTDYSGNSNTWTVNNISLTAGTTYDSMTDVPTLTSATTANYCTWNPLKSISSTSTYQNGNLQVTFPSGAAGGIATGTMAVSSGKWYWEITVGGTDGNTQPKIGVISPTVDTQASGSLDIATYGYAYSINGTKWILGVNTAYGATFTTGDVIGFALDMDAGTLVCYKNNTSQGTLATGLSGLLTPGITAYNGYTESANFGQQGFKYTPPTGFVALNTFNLPTSTIVKGNTVMDASLYTGNATSVTVTNTAGFKPDLVWGKSRSNAINNSLVDSNRGVSKSLFSNLTDAEDSAAGYYITGFNSNGFTVGLGTTLNTNGATYVGWQWQAGQGTNTSNTSGSITSTVSVNATAGFSIVTWTGNGTAGATVGHGLGVAPSMVIVKRRSAASNWSVSSPVIGATKVLFLEQTAAATTDNGPFNSTLASSSVITLGSSTDTNASGGTFVAYCWSQIAGFSSFGSYTGNLSSDGPFIYLGFKPAFIMVKSTVDSTRNWSIWDNKRNTYNVVTNRLLPNDSSAEITADDLDFTSNGFKIRRSGGDFNLSGSNYIYMAFAENPFKNALAR